VAYEYHVESKCTTCKDHVEGYVVGGVQGICFVCGVCGQPHINALGSLKDTLPNWVMEKLAEECRVEIEKPRSKSSGGHDPSIHGPLH
jgi:hypothetical protein